MAQKQAQEAAERARQLATQASVKAMAFAEQAAEQAKVLADKAKNEAAQHKLFDLTVPTSNQQQAVEATPEECQRYGITEQLIEYVGSLTYSTFSDHNSNAPPTGKASEDSAFTMNPWQTRHALLMVEKVVQLHDLRFVLCPRRMSDEQFWKIYFELTRKYLPPQAFDPNAPLEPVPPPPPPAHAPRSSPASDTKALAQSPVASKPESRDHSPVSLKEEPLESCAWSDPVDVDLDEKELDELENDPELAAYLQEAMQLDDAAGLAGGVEDVSDLSDDVEDLDDYINQLDAELNDDEKK